MRVYPSPGLYMVWKVLFIFFILLNYIWRPTGIPNQLWFFKPSIGYKMWPNFRYISLFSILLTHEGSYREAYRDFQPSLTSSAGPVTRVVQTTGSMHPKPTLPKC